MIFSHYSTIILHNNTFYQSNKQFAILLAEILNFQGAKSFLSMESLSN